jgi:hypothetical protein
MNSKPASFDDFLSEISASLKEDSGEGSLRRINTERVLKLVLDDIVEQRHDVQIRVLNDHRISGDIGADILMQIDDYDIRLEILDTADDSCRLSKDQMTRFKEIFEENPSTETLILTWTTNDLKSIQLTLSLIDQMTLGQLDSVTLDNIDSVISSNSDVFDFTQKTRSLVEVINEILESRIKVWGKILAVPQEKGRTTTDIRMLFKGHFQTCLEEERSRSFKLEERKAAAVTLSEKEATELLNGILDKALTGEESEIMAKRLSQLPKRGGK